MARIALVAGSDDISQHVWQMLREGDHDVELLESSQSLAREIRSCRPELVVYDCERCGRLSEDELGRIRRSARVPLVVLGAAYDELFVVRALELGADACLCRPFGASELRAHVTACLRRYWVWGGSGLQSSVDGLSMNALSHSVMVTGREVQLTPAEYRLLSTLLKRPGQVVPREQLCEQIWGLNADAMSRTNLNLCVYNLRQKLERDPHNPEYVRTKWGIGYYLGLGS